MSESTIPTSCPGCGVHLSQVLRGGCEVCQGWRAEVVAEMLAGPDWSMRHDQTAYEIGQLAIRAMAHAEGALPVELGGLDARGLRRAFAELVTNAHDHVLLDMIREFAKSPTPQGG